MTTSNTNTTKNKDKAWFVLQTKRVQFLCSEENRCQLLSLSHPISCRQALGKILSMTQMFRNVYVLYIHDTFCWADSNVYQCPHPMHPTTIPTLVTENHRPVHRFKLSCRKISAVPSACPAWCCVPSHLLSVSHIGLTSLSSAPGKYHYVQPVPLPNVQPVPLPK